MNFRDLFRSVGQPRHARIQIVVGETAHKMAHRMGGRNTWVDAAFSMMEDQKIPQVYIERGAWRKTLLRALRKLTQKPSLLEAKISKRWPSVTT